MKRIIGISLVAMCVCVSCKSTAHTGVANTGKKSADNVQQNTISLPDSIINFGRNYLRTPYRYGGTTSKGFDCSGFTSHVYKNFGYDLDRSSRDQAKQFPVVKKKELQVGDLVFFEGRSHNGNVGHVGIVSATKPNGEFDFIHASVQQGVIVSASSEPYYASRYLKAGRVLDNATGTSYARNATAASTSKMKEEVVAASNAAVQHNIVEALYYTVQKGDNLTKISMKFDVPISTIQHLNGLTSKRIKRGQRLLITEAVTIPTMPIAEVQRTLGTDVPGNESNSFAIIKPQTTTAGYSVGSVRAVVEEPKQPEVVSLPDRKIAEQVTLPTGEKHKVTAGESLYSIAKKYNISVDELKAMNGVTSNNISAGQLLIVNTSVETVEETSPVTILDTPSAKEPLIHSVKKGDTLYSIARMYNCSIHDLKKWNDNLSDAIKIGDKIKIER